MHDLPPGEERAALSRVTRRLIPFAFLCYVVAYIVAVAFQSSLALLVLGFTLS